MSRHLFSSALLALGLFSTPSFATHPEEQACCFEAEQTPSDAPAYLVPLDLDLCGYLTFKPGLRIQTRYLHDCQVHEHDIMIRRFRLKGSGEAFGLANYAAELKIDGVGRWCNDAKAGVENAWVQFPIMDLPAHVRIGLFDVPFSRNALSSDSKLIFMDRSLIKNALSSLGLTDNGIGVLLHGRPNEGQFEYAIGLFDNEKFEKIGADGERYSKWLMPAGRFVINVFDPSKPGGYGDYRESYLCEGKRLALGINGAWLNKATDGDEQFDLYAWGVDTFFNWECLSCQGEFDWFRKSSRNEDVDDETGYGWYAQLAYMVHSCVELAARYEDLDADCHDGDERRRYYALGMNIYFRQHNLKLQTDYTFRRQKGEDLANTDVFQIQLQLDF